MINVRESTSDSRCYLATPRTGNGEKSGGTYATFPDFGRDHQKLDSPRFLFPLIRYVHCLEKLSANGIKWQCSAGSGTALERSEAKSDIVGNNWWHSILLESGLCGRVRKKHCPVEALRVRLFTVRHSGLSFRKIYGFASIDGKFICLLCHSIATKTNVGITVRNALDSARNT